MRKILIVFMTFLFVAQAFAQTSGEDPRLTEIKKHYGAKEFDLARQKLESWMASAPENFPAAGFLLLGNLYDHAGLFSAAMQIYEKGLAVAPNKIPFYLNLSQVARHMKDYQKSLEYLSFLKDAEKRIPEILLFKGMSQFELRQRMAVIESWETYLSYRTTGQKPDKVRRALDWLKRKDFKWPEDLEKEDALKAEDLKKFLEDLKKSVESDREKQIRQNPEVKEEKLEIQDQGVQEGEKFDEVER